MRITKGNLISAWRRKAAGSEVLDGAVLPPIVTMGDDHEPPDLEPEELYLEIGDDGLVRGYEGEEEELFAADDLDLVLYFIAEEVTRTLTRQTDADASSGQGAVVRQAELLDRIDAAWGRRSPGTSGCGSMSRTACWA